MSDQNKDEKTYWLDDPKNVTRICWLIGIICVGLGGDGLFLSQAWPFQRRRDTELLRLFRFCLFLRSGPVGQGIAQADHAG